jgi:hypothetical protein|eukprot:COSAG01_NODE_2107_length_8406_cov_21.249158_2_plen_231_part_00
MLGTLAEFGLGALIPSWRTLYAINGLAFTPCLLLAACIPASPRWLHMSRVRRRQKQQQQRVRQGGGGGSSDVTTASDNADVMRALSRFYGAGVALAPLFEELAPSTKSAALRPADGSDKAAVGGGGGGRDDDDPAHGGGGLCSAPQRRALLLLRTPVAMCAFLAVTMQLAPGGTVVVLFSAPILEGFAPERRNEVALLCNAAALPGERATGRPAQPPTSTWPLHLARAAM